MKHIKISQKSSVITGLQILCMSIVFTTAQTIFAQSQNEADPCYLGVNTEFDVNYSLKLKWQQEAKVQIKNAITDGSIVQNEDSQNFLEQTMVKVQTDYYDVISGTKSTVTGHGVIVSYGGKPLIYTAAHLTQGQNTRFFNLRGNEIFAKQWFTTNTYDFSFFEIKDLSVKPLYDFDAKNKSFRWDLSDKRIKKIPFNHLYSSARTFVPVIDKKDFNRGFLYANNDFFLASMFVGINTMSFQKEAAWCNAANVGSSYFVSNLIPNGGASGSPMLAPTYDKNGYITHIDFVGLLLFFNQSSERTFFLRTSFVGLGSKHFLNLLKSNKLPEESLKWKISNGQTFRVIEDQFFELEMKNSKKGNGVNIDKGNGVNIDKGNGVNIDKGLNGLATSYQNISGLKTKNKSLFGFKSDLNKSKIKSFILFDFNSFHERYSESEEEHDLESTVTNTSDPMSVLQFNFSKQNYSPDWPAIEVQEQLNEPYCVVNFNKNSDIDIYLNLASFGKINLHQSSRLSFSQWLEPLSTTTTKGFNIKIDLSGLFFSDLINKIIPSNMRSFEANEKMYSDDYLYRHYPYVNVKFLPSKNTEVPNLVGSVACYKGN
ncbi:MAG: hypothetical protein ACOYOK_12920 [Pseudobdellovibrionaceae bacterium]